MLASWPKPPDTLEALVDPRLDGAACAGMAPMFDDEIDGETPDSRAVRLAHARTICARCMVRSACTVAAAEHQATGLWAGRLHTTPDKFHSTRRPA
jgi:hypothetical protein